MTLNRPRVMLSPVEEILLEGLGEPQPDREVLEVLDWLLPWSPDVEGWCLEEALDAQSPLL